MASRRNLQKPIESNKNWQSTPAVKNPLSAKQSFEDRMPFTDPPSPVLQEHASGEVKTKQKPTPSQTQISSQQKKPSTYNMVCNAIETLGAGKKGSSVPAIKNWILGNYGGIETNRINLLVRKAILKGLETGGIQRSAKTTQQTGVRGFFVLAAKKKLAKKSGVKKKPMGPGSKPKPTKTTTDSKKAKKTTHASDSEVTIIKPDKRKSAKPHVSDSELPADSTILQLKSKEKPSQKAGSKKQKQQEKPKLEKKPAAMSKKKPQQNTEKKEKAKPNSAHSTQLKNKNKPEEKSEAKKNQPKKASAKQKAGEEESTSGKGEFTAASKRVARNK